MEKRLFYVEKAKQRLDAFLALKADISRSMAKKAIELGNCLVNEEEVKPDYKVRLNDCISYTPLIISNSLEAEEGELNILYQDDDYIIINKPPNLTVHPSPSQETNTLVHLLINHFPSIAQMEGQRPGIVHRIDKDTSGILIIALHDKARRAITELFATREVHKEYLALVHNVPQREQTIELPIGRHETVKTKMAVKKSGKYALTDFKILHADTERNYALLAVRIHTGRTHQIRVHLSHIGLPLWGDKLYTSKVIKEVPASLKDRAKRQMLHAWKISFVQPLTHKEINIVCPPPEDMQDCIQMLRTKTQKYIITGNPASGKSTVLNVFKELGYPTFSADAYVQELYKKNNAGTFLLHRLLGDSILTKEKEVDKQALFEYMQVEETRKKIEALIHPLVYRAMFEFFQKHENNIEKKVFAEVPLYFESTTESNKEYKVITVWTKEDICAKRLASRNNKALYSFLNALHLSAEEKRAKADICIENSGTLEELKEKCMNI